TTALVVAVPCNSLLEHCALRHRMPLVPFRIHGLNTYLSRRPRTAISKSLTSATKGIVAALPIIEAFNVELRAQGKGARDPWYVALFYMTGEVVCQALADRGIS